MGQAGSRAGSMASEAAAAAGESAVIRQAKNKPIERPRPRPMVFRPEDVVAAQSKDENLLKNLHELKIHELIVEKPADTEHSMKMPETQAAYLNRPAETRPMDIPEPGLLLAKEIRTVLQTLQKDPNFPVDQLCKEIQFEPEVMKNFVEHCRAPYFVRDISGKVVGLWDKPKKDVLDTKNQFGF
eukprot:GILI01005921.1.p2 GENE.GILI01005921.1~~GILI01005921.1.p2  ORF type:complete len:184 (-),score=33.89 GILI01005921.1:714-1265(-)